MLETEIKFPVKSLGGIRAKLKELRFRLAWKGQEENYYFDTPRRTLRGRGKTLRLRRWTGHSVTLTLKAVPKQRGSRRYKTRQEYQLYIDDLTTARRLLTGLGFAKWLRYKKYREHWILPGVSVELDRLGSRHFVEIEAAPLQIRRVAGQLGLEWRQGITQSYLQLLAQSRR